MKNFLHNFKFRPLMLILALVAVAVFVATAGADPSV